MQSINYKMLRFICRRRREKRYFFVLALLSVMVVVIVVLSLVTPAISMTGELVCGKEEHTHDDSCYTKTLICTEDTTGHQHSEECYTETSVLTCGLEEDENHTHSDECYTTEKVLTCEIPESTEHVHNDECYEYTLTCEKEEHKHTDECYKTPPSETESTDSAQEDVTEEETTIATEPEEEIIEVDPIDAERDALLNSVKSKSVKTVYTYSVYGNATIIDSASVDFGGFITNVSHKDVAGVTNEKGVKTVKFTINYSLPANTLLDGSENKQIHCKLPDNTVITELKTGIVRKEGQEIGTYAITDDGYIIIEFDQNFVKDGSAKILGDISFNANVIKSSENSNYETVTIGAVSVNIPFPTEEIIVPSDDLSVNKSYVGYDKDTKKVTYRMEIKSYNGSGEGDITVTDMLWYTDSGLISLDWVNDDTVTFTKKDSSGATSSVNATVSVDSEGKATITGLPKLNANESYTLDYTATLTPDGNTQIIKTNNKVTVSNGTLNDESVYYGETAVSCGISKRGQYNDRTDLVEWNINVTNPFGDSLDGYSITDDMLGITANGLKIKDGNGTVIETLDQSNNWTGTTGSLDKSTNTFTFNSSASNVKYTLTYETPLPDRSAIANNTISNKAILKSSGSEISAPTADAYIGSDRHGINKYCRSSSYDSSGNVLMDWYVTLDGQAGDFNSQTYKDTMTSDGDNHYMTPAQKNTLVITGYKADGSYDAVSLVKDTDYTVKWYDVAGAEITADTENIYSFDVIFTDNSTVGALSDIDIYYTATGITTDMTAGSERVFTNKAVFLDLDHTSAYTEKKKEPFYKYDSSVSGQNLTNSETQHNANELTKDENGNYILKWYIEANESNYYASDEDITLTDTLPAGTVFTEGSLRYGDWRNGYFSLVESNTVTYETAQGANQQTVTFHIPASDHSGKKFRLEYSITLTEDYLIQNKNEQGNTVFRNVVTDGSYTTEQTQKIERSLIEKTGSDPANSYDGYIKYEIDINPNGELLSNNGKITVSDTINYQWNAFIPTMTDFKVYSVVTNPDDSETLSELNPSEYNLNYSSDGINAAFTVTLPDRTHLRIKYTYRCVYKNPEWFEPIDNGINIYNQTSLTFDSITQLDSYQNKYYLNKESDAHAVTDDYLKIEKVDAENYGLKLSGAEFALYKWDGSAWLVMTAENDTSDGGKEPVWSTEESTPYKVTTADNGKAMFPRLEEGTLYRLLEITAPTGYIGTKLPFYFAENTTPSAIPSDVTSTDIKILTKSGSFTIPNNKMQETKISAQKYWHDPPGFSGIHDSVEVELFQSKTDPSGKTDGPEITFSFSDNKENYDTRTFNVKHGANLQIGLRTLGGYFNQTSGGSIKLNGEVVNIYNNTLTGFSWKNPVWNYAGSYQEDWQNNPSLYCEYFLTYSNVTENMNWEVYFDNAQSFTEYAVFIGNQEVGVRASGDYMPDDAVSVGTAILSSENGWKHEWNNIPATDEFGYNYYYYVRENTAVATYTPSYDGNGANSGTIYITNRGEGYTNEMPATGGMGSRTFVVTGFIMISGSAILYLFCRRHRKSRNQT